MAAQFRRLPDLEISDEQWNDPLPLGPEGLRHGVLQNGMRCEKRPLAKRHNKCGKKVCITHVEAVKRVPWSGTS